MTYIAYIKSFVVIILSSIALDYIWLNFIAKRVYFEGLAPIARKIGGSLTVYAPSALLVYCLLALGIIIFVLPRISGNLFYAFFWGALFGFIVYGIYDFTNHAILTHYPFTIGIIDVLWGTVLCGILTLLATLVSRN